MGSKRKRRRRHARKGKRVATPAPRRSGIPHPQTSASRVTKPKAMWSRRRVVAMAIGLFAIASLTDAEPFDSDVPFASVRPAAMPATDPLRPTVVVPGTATPAPAGSLAVRVSANGAAIANAEVSITDGSRPTLATAKTDREGVARFRDLVPGHYELWARHEASVSKLARVADLATAHDIALALEPAGTISGRLEGVRDATITLSPLDVDHVERTAMVDATGRFAIAGVPQGRWRLESAAPGHVQDGEQILDVKGDRDDIALRMLKAGSASGTVVDGSGAPVAHATIVLRKQGAGLDERAPITLAPRLRWVHPLAGRRILPHTEFLRFGSSRSGTRPAECGQGHCGVDIGWERGTVIHAAADGEIAIAFVESRGEAGRAIAIEHGDGVRTYYMHLDELRPNLQVGHRVRAGDALGTMGATGAASGPHLHFALTQERGGRTWFLDPEPILRHAVVLPQARTLEPLGPVDKRDAALIASHRRDAAPQAFATTIVTDARGRFRADNVAPGSYVAVAFAAELAPNTSNPFAVRPGDETPDVAIALRPGVLVTGRVLGRDGPAAGARVTAGTGSGESVQQVAATTTNPQGEFTLRALSGTITLSVTAPGHGVIERSLALGERGPPRREDFSLVVEDTQLRGQVLAPDGGPVPHVSVRIVDGPTRRQAVTDSAGRFTIERAAAGRYTLEVTSVDHPPTRVSAESDRWTEIRLARGGGLRVDLRDAHSSAMLSGIDIAAIGPGERKASAVTDARGVATLRGLVPGDWTVVVHAKGYTRSRRAVTVRASSTPDDVRIELARSVTLAGVVRDRRGRRVANARVWVDTVQTQTDADGNFRIVDAPAGSYWLQAEQGGARGHTAVELSPGGERLTLGIELDQ